jgi:hypothetical protein
MATYSIHDLSDSPPDTSEPDLPDLPNLPTFGEPPILDEMYDFGVAGQEISQTVVASPHEVAQSVPLSSERGRSESHVPWASPGVEDPSSDDEDGLFADGLELVSDDEPDEVEPAPTEERKWKVNHARGDHRLDGK